MRELQHNAHSVFSMYYHLVLVVKYRRKVIDDNVSVRLQEIFDKIAPKYGLSCEEWNHDVDHVHIMFTVLLLVLTYNSKKKCHILVYRMTLYFTIMIVVYTSSKIESLKHLVQYLLVRFIGIIRLPLMIVI